MDGYSNGGGEQARAKMVAPPPGFKNKWNEQTKEWDHIPRDVPVNHAAAGSGSASQPRPVEFGRGGGSGPVPPRDYLLSNLVPRPLDVRASQPSSSARPMDRPAVDLPPAKNKKQRSPSTHFSQPLRLSTHATPSFASQQPQSSSSGPSRTTYDPPPHFDSPSTLPFASTSALSPPPPPRPRSPAVQLTAASSQLSSAPPSSAQETSSMSTSRAGSLISDVSTDVDRRVDPVIMYFVKCIMLDEARTGRPSQLVVGSREMFVSMCAGPSKKPKPKRLWSKERTVDEWLDLYQRNKADWDRRVQRQREKKAKDAQVAPLAGGKKRQRSVLSADVHVEPGPTTLGAHDDLEPPPPKRRHSIVEFDVPMPDQGRSSPIEREEGEIVDEDPEPEEETIDEITLPPVEEDPPEHGQELEMEPEDEQDVDMDELLREINASGSEASPPSAPNMLPPVAPDDETIEGRPQPGHSSPLEAAAVPSPPAAQRSSTPPQAFSPPPSQLASTIQPPLRRPPRESSPLTDLPSSQFVSSSIPAPVAVRPKTENAVAGPSTLRRPKPVYITIPDSPEEEQHVELPSAGSDADIEDGDEADPSLLARSPKKPSRKRRRLPNSPPEESVKGTRSPSLVARVTQPVVRRKSSSSQTPTSEVEEGDLRLAVPDEDNIEPMDAGPIPAAAHVDFQPPVNRFNRFAQSRTDGPITQRGVLPDDRQRKLIVTAAEGLRRTKVYGLYLEMNRLRKIFNVYAVERAQLESKSIEDIRTIIGGEFDAMDEEKKEMDQAKVVELEVEVIDLRTRLDKALGDSVKITRMAEELHQTVETRDKTVEDQKTHLATLVNTISSNRAERGAKDLEVAQLKAQLERSQAYGQSQAQAADALQASIEQSKEETRTARESAQEFEAMLNTERLKVTRLRRDNDALTASDSQADVDAATLADLHTRLVASEKLAEERLAHIDDLEKTFVAPSDALSRRVQELSQSEATLKSRCAGFEQEMRALGTRYNDQAGELATRTAQVQGLQTQLESAKSARDAAIAARDDLDAKVMRNQASMSNTRTALEASQRDSLHWARQKTELGREMATKDMTIAARSKEIDELTKKSANDIAHLRSLTNEKIQGLETKLRAADKNFEQVRLMYSNLSNTRDIELNQSQDAIHQATLKVAALEARIKELEGVRGQMYNLLADAKREGEELARGLQEQLAEAQKNVERGRQTSAAYMSQRDDAIRKTAAEADRRRLAEEKIRTLENSVGTHPHSNPYHQQQQYRLQQQQRPPNQ